MDPDQQSPWNDKDSSRKQDRLAIISSNVVGKDILQQSEGSERHHSSSSTISFPIAPARSHLSEEGRIPLNGGSLYPSGQYRRGGLGLDRDQGLLGPYDTSRQQVSCQYRSSDLGWDRSKGLLGPYDASRQQVRTFLPPNMRPMKSLESHSHYQNMRNDNSRQPVKMPQNPSKESPRPQSPSPPKTGLSSHMMMSDQAPLKVSNIDASMRWRNGQDDSLGLSGWIARKRLNAKTSFNNVEELGNVTARKKTRLDWGQGLAKYEKQQKEKQLLNAQDIQANGDLNKSSTSLTKTVVCPPAFPAFPHDPSPSPAVGDNGELNNSSTTMIETIVSPAALPATSEGSSPPQAVGANGEHINSSTSMTEALVCPAVLPASSNGGCPPPDVEANNGINGNSSMGSEKVVCPTDVPAFSHGRSPPPGVGANSGDIGNSSMSMSETIVYPTARIASSNGGCSLPQGANYGDPGSNMSLSETVVCRADVPALSHGRNPPLGATGDLGNSSMTMTETVVCPAIVPAFSHECSLPPAVGANNGDNGNSSMSISETVVCSNVPALSHEHCLPPDVGANGDVGNSSMSMTDMVVYTAIVPTFSHRSSLPPGTNNSDHSNSSMNLPETVVCQADVPALSQEHNLSPGANGDFGDSGISLTAGTAVCAADMTAFSHGCSPPPASGDNGDLGNSSTIITETVICPTTLPASSHGCNPSPDGSFATTTEGQDIAHKLISQCSNKIQGNARMLAIILEKLQAPRTKFLKKDATNTVCGDGDNYPVIGSSVQDRLGRMIFAENSSDKITEDPIGGDQNRTVLKECHGAAKNWEAKETDTEDNDENVKSDMENPQPCVASEECSAIQLSCNVHSHKIENVDIIPSLEGNKYNAPPMQTSDEEHKISHLSSSSGAAALPTNHAKTSGVKMAADLNVPLDVAPIDVDFSLARASVNMDTKCAEASIDPNATHQTTLFDLNIPDPTSMEAESNERGRATFHFAGTSEMADQQCRTAMPANQPRCIMLFGKLICQEPSSDSNPTSRTDYQIDGHSSGIPSHKVVPSTARDGRTYSSGPRSTWSSTPINPSQQSVFSNQMPYGLVNGGAALPLQSRSSAFVNWSQQTHSVNMTPYSMMRGGVGYNLKPGSSSSGLVNFIPRQQQWTSGALDASRMVIGYPCLPDTSPNQASGAVTPSGPNGFIPRQQQWTSGGALDASRMVRGYPCLPDTTPNQAAGAVTPSKPNGEGTSASNARKGKEKR